MLFEPRRTPPAAAQDAVARAYGVGVGAVSMSVSESVVGGRRQLQPIKGVFLLYRVKSSTSLANRSRSARPSLIPSLCTRFTRADIEWRR